MGDKIWRAAAVPLDYPRRGFSRFGPYYDYCSAGPHLWQDGQLITPGWAADLTGMSIRELDAISSRWKVVVDYVPQFGDGCVLPVRWLWHWHSIAVPIRKDWSVINPEVWYPEDWADKTVPHYTTCEWLPCDYVMPGIVESMRGVGRLDRKRISKRWCGLYNVVTANIAAAVRGVDESECERVSPEWCILVEWHVEDLMPGVGEGRYE